jgi:2-oxoglutarate dehydrogenase E1 component
VLRRQAQLLTSDPLPLVLLTPKSLLRHPLTASAPHELAEGRFQLVIDDDEARRQAGRIRRLVLCSGKIHVDLVSSERRTPDAGVALVRVEQVYPFPSDELRAVLDRYPKLREVCWVQEEPENMGAWEFVRPHLEALVSGRARLALLARPRSSSPAEGSAARHARNQQMLIQRALRTQPQTADQRR